MWFTHQLSCDRPVTSVILRPSALPQDSELVAGVAFKKTFSYAGFEMQPKSYKNPKIAMLQIELELKAERDNAEIRLDNVQVSRPRLSGDVTHTR